MRCEEQGTMQRKAGRFGSKDGNVEEPSKNKRQKKVAVEVVEVVKEESGNEGADADDDE